MGNDAFGLKHKVALATGSTLGIGEATARTMAQAGDRHRAGAGHHPRGAGRVRRGDGLCSRCRTPPGGQS